MATTATILLVEDNEDDAFIMRRALRAAGIANPMHVVETGQDAVDYLAGAERFEERTSYPLPRIVFLDLKLPIMMGMEVLAWIRTRRELEGLVVVVLTSSNEPSDVKEAYRLGANSYVVKPPTADQLLGLAKAFKWDWLEVTNTSDP
jgi:CheY-like chemotaxis protein